ncbi:MAG: alpha-2-macroglobulin [Rubrivivax sp.]|nr:alpha-2-macroglobulin [Rubrivivax sp.]
MKTYAPQAGWPFARHVARLVARLAAMLALSAVAAAAQAVRVAAVSPQGEVGVVRQVVVRFDVAAVSAGDPRAAAPFRLTCNGVTPAGNGYWADDRRWIFDLNEPLAAGQRCVLRAEAAFRPGGAALEGAGEFTFSTGAPAVLRIQPSPGTRIEEDQHFLVQLTGPVDPESVVRNAWCEVEGLGERLPLTLASAALRDQVLRRHGRYRAGDTRAAADAARHLLLACQRPFAPEARVRLVWGAGIASVPAAGQAALVTRERQQWQWQVRPRFLAEFSCERESAGAPCLPLRALTLRFNTPVPREAAAAVRLVPAEGGAAIAPKLDDEDRRAATLQELRFAAPLPENTRFQVTLPAGLKDETGRSLDNAASFPLAVATGGLPPLAKFAGAPFGIVEAAPGGSRSGRAAEAAMLPLTLRHVQADLAGLATTGQVAVKRLPPELTDAALLAWIARVQHWHERDLPAKEAGLPPSQWSETVTETERLADGRTRTRTVRRERFVPSRELSIFVGEVDVRRAELPQLKDTAPSSVRATEVLGVPLPERGYHVVEVGSRLLGEALLAKREPMYTRTGVLVTNLAVHFKKGRSSSLVWVTSLDRGRPVAGARVTVNDCRGQPLWSGATDAAGIARVERGFDEAQESEGRDGHRCLTNDGLFVTARTAAPVPDLGFVFSRWVKGIEPWRFNVALAGGTAPDRRAHTVLDRELLKRGETVSMKHFVRDEVERGLAYTAPEHLPDTLVIRHVGSGQEVTLPLAWNGSPARSALSQWAVPKTAALGLYDVLLKRGDREWVGGAFRVEDFRVPLVDARLAGPRGVVVAPGEVAFGAQVNAMSGGPMPGLPLALSAVLREREPRFAGHEDFSFTVASRGRDEEFAEGADGEGDGARTVARQLPARTDAQGAARLAVPNLPPLRGPAELLAEVSFADPNGETQTVARRVPLWPASVVVGVRAPDWAAQRGAARFTAVVLDTEGKPLAGRAVEVIGRAHRFITTRQRIVGGFYSYDNQRRTQELGELCSGKTDAQGRLNCDARVEHTGEVELLASAKDDAGRTSQASASVWVTSEDAGERLWFAQGNDDRIDILPEKRELEPGQVARLQVRMPFKQATALVTVEREGVVDARVLTLAGREPVIELPIPAATDGGASWAPNVTVGVLALRGRLREAPWWSIFTWGWREPLEWWRAFRYEGKDWRAPAATVDLAKPSFKFGVAQLRIGAAAHRLDVKVTTPQAQYKVRDKVTATVRVSFQGRPLAGADVAFAAVDEGLLALAENRSWDLLGGLLRERPWGVETATAVNEVIGRRHYGRKALPPGGGGGRNPTRELFDTLLVWRGSVALDSNGEARIEVPLNDSLTSFRLVAIADAGADRFGQGHAVVRVTQDLQVLPGLAPLAREGDRFDAGFTVRNGSTRAMQVRATLVGSAVGAAPGGATGASGAPPGAAVALSFAPQAVQLAAGAAMELRWPVQVPPGTTRIDWSVGAAEEGAAGGGPARDSVKLSQAVAPVVPVRVLQATLAPLHGSASLPVAAPADSLPGRGGLQVALQPRLAGSTGALPGLRRYFENYPYSCLEQKVSRTLALGDQPTWQTLRDELAGYLDADGLAGYFPPAPGSAARGSDRLTAYVLAAAHEAGFALPDASREAMLGGLVAFVEGRLERRFPAPRPDLDMRKLAALDALARHGRADARWWGSITFTPATWPTSALLDAWSALQRSPGLPDRDTRLAELQRLVRSRLAEGGTTLRFSTEAEDDQWWWLMESADANAARLLLVAMAAGTSPAAAPAWKDELPRLVNGTLARQKGGAWRTTTANLWGVLALQRFTQVFEAEGVGGRSIVELAGTARTVDWGGATGGQGATLLLPWPAATPGAPPAPLAVRHEGTGRPWLTVQSLAAVPLRAPLAAGYRITRSTSVVTRRVPDAWSRGDVMRVRLEIDATADMAWVVVSDPLPAGASHLGTGLGRDSGVATQGERREGAAWAAYEERAQEAWRAYFAWLPRGRHVVEYTIRLNTAGRLGLPPARVEAMYAPETFGELPLAPVEVQP